MMRKYNGTLPYSLELIADWCGAQVVNAQPNLQVRELLVDSRQLADPAGTLFFALPGQRVDGHAFVADLYERGVRQFVVREAPAELPMAAFLVVEDVLSALQTIAARHRANFSIPVIGVTGSNGKTVVKEWLYHLLAPHRQVVRSPRSYNSRIGVPLSVWQLRPEHELAIFEAGISQRGEMDALAAIIQPTIGIFTNLGEAHSEGFRDQAEKLAEKLKLFTEVQCLIYCRDQPTVSAAVEAMGVPTLSWSLRSAADLQVRQVERQLDGVAIQADYRGQIIAFRIPFTDQASLENALHCCCACLYLGLPVDDLAKAMTELPPVSSRLELKAGRNDSTLIDDTYSNDLTSLTTALSFMAQQQRRQRRTVVLSDLLQSGLSREELYRQVGALLTGHTDRLIGVGGDIPTLAAYLPAAIEQHYFPTTESLLAVLDDFDFQREIILLKGARFFAFERLTVRLVRQYHRTILEIDLRALSHNLAVFRQRLAPGVGLAVMVKAAAYGSGSLEVARLLESSRIEYLVVAYPDEGVTLRRGGIHGRIIVLNAEPHTFEQLLRYQLEPEIFSWQQLQTLAEVSERLGQDIAFHLKLDTGMHRLGFFPEEAEALGATIHSHLRLRVASVLTHLAASENPEHDDYTHQQVAAFGRAYEQLSAQLGYQPQRHVLNSSGIARFPQYQYELVRLGIGLYGVESSGVLAARLQPVLHLRARVSQVKDLPVGASVGYGRAARLTRDSRIATLSIGYADGFPRRVGYGRYAVSLHGRAAPTVGAICMDMCMVDVTDIPQAREGDTATIFSHQPSVYDLAKAAETITYEILTGLSTRLHRIYVYD